MFFVFSKLFDLFTSPINWIVALLLCGLFIRKKKYRRRIIITAMFLFILFTNGRLFVLAISAWSKAYNNPVATAQPYDIAIVAGGSVGYSAQWHQLDYNEKGDRITEAIRLYRMGIIKKIYFSGEAAFNESNGVCYAAEFMTYMEQMGVPREAIILDQKARSTRENIINISALLANQRPQTPLLLITSGWHMRRLLQGFKGSGLNLVPYGVDVPSWDSNFTWQDLLPSWEVALEWQKLIHEMVGILII